MELDNATTKSELLESVHVEFKIAELEVVESEFVELVMTATN